MKYVTLKEQICAAVGLIGTFVAHAFGGFDEGLATLLIFMGIDYATGLIVAAIFKNSPKTADGGLESRAGWKGLVRKGITLLFVLIGHRLDMLLGVDYIRNAVIIGFIANDLISIVENTGLMGVPLPAVITNSIEILKKKSAEE